MIFPQKNGIVWPLNEKGERPTTETSIRIWAKSFEQLGDEKATNAVKNEKNWRHGYVKHVIKHVELSLTDGDRCVKAAQSGLDAFYDEFQFIRDGNSMKLSDAMKIKGTKFHTAVIKGSKSKDNLKLEIPYKDKVLTGDDIIKQVNKWANYGTIEKSTAEAITKVVQNKTYVDLSDKYFVLLGAGSAMGPFYLLMALGANVIGVDLAREGIWKRLCEAAENSCGTLTFPVAIPQNQCTTPEMLYKNGGCNLMEETPEGNNWLQTVHPGKELVVGCYTYLDGEAHVRVALACDAIMRGLSEERKATLAYLCTPTDVHCIPEDANKAARKNYDTLNWKNLLMLPFRTFGGKKFLVKNALRPVKDNKGKDRYYADELIVPQGPNYALAKRMQHWRAIVARDIGCKVSTNIAPSTSTVSVTSNRSFAWAYDGMPFFVPIEIFEQKTSNAVMGALLIHDVNNPNSVANPAQRKLDNPLELFAENSFHGGMWRCGYKSGSLGEVSVIIHFIKVLRPVLIAIAVLILFFIYRRFF